ncbi:lipase 1-like [Thrips palmi]|uniref:Lipase n=1 Tax=Thrips palmi TaxID=161013 RepID=A0A6P8YQM7_THRPL|nr:lipase 1-like [Thrips palmi]
MAAFRTILAVSAVLLAAAEANLRAPANTKVPTEAWLTTPELIEFWGYPGETHTVVTEDGYVVDVHRILGRRGQVDKPRRRKTPVLIAHGYGASSECMVLRDNNTLAFMLANEDFDVWLGNTRGNFYGRRHSHLSSADQRFWDFSWHENGVFDMRATIDYMLATTGEASVAVLGHSMGATSLFALLAEMPEYNAKVRAAFLLGPAVYFHSVRGTFNEVRKRAPWSERTLSLIRLENFMTRAPYPRLCFSNLGGGMTINPNCIRVFTDAQGPFFNTNHNTYLPILLRHWPAGTSVGQLAHFMQLIVKGDGFKKFDHGPERNRVLYGTASPPPYNLTNVRSPCFFYYCDNDYQANPKDVRRLAADVPGTAGLFRTPARAFNHLDIMYEEAAGELVYKRLLRDIAKYRN